MSNTDKWITYGMIAGLSFFLGIAIGGAASHIQDYYRVKAGRMTVGHHIYYVMKVPD